MKSTEELIHLSSIDIDSIDPLDVGNSIQLAGAVWTGNDKIYIVPLPDEDFTGDWKLLNMDISQWERFLQQSDVLDIRGPGKSILRKSQRQIDQNISWEVYRRDNYRCRYCGREGPLTVDHVILWEEGGATVADNLVASCRRCNKLRGNTPYDKWIVSDRYARVSMDLDPDIIYFNKELCKRLDMLRQIKSKPRSR